MRSKVIASVMWKLLERGGTQGIQFVVQIILARLLTPDVYGTIALVTVFISLAQVFVQSGLGTALIQKQDADEIDFSSVLYVNIALAVLVYTMLFFSAPLIANFYSNSELTLVLRVLGFILFFGAINGVQNAYIARKLMFKELFKLSVLAMLISGISGVLAAYLGLGLWALVIQQLVNHAAIMIILWFSIGWRPVYKFSLSRVKQLLSFGYKLLLSSTIDTLYRELRTLIIGKVYSTSTLGFYNKGEQFPKLIMSNIDGSIQAVMLPTLSSHQDDRPKVKAMMRRSIVTSCFVVFPVMIGLSVIAEPLVRLLLTEKWIPAVPYLQVFSLSYMLWPIHTANLQAINALGRSDIFLKLELLKKILGVTILSISVPLGVFAIAIGSVVGGIVASFINAMPNKKLLDYSYTEQILDVFPSLVAAIVMGFVVFFVSFMGLHVIFQILVQIIVGAIVYLSIAHVFKFESYVYLKTYLTDIFSNRKESYVMEKKNDNKQ